MWMIFNWQRNQRTLLIHRCPFTLTNQVVTGHKLFYLLLFVSCCKLYAFCQVYDQTTADGTSSWHAPHLFYLFMTSLEFNTHYLHSYYTNQIVYFWKLSWHYPKRLKLYPQSYNELRQRNEYLEWLDVLFMINTKLSGKYNKVFMSY